MQDPLPKGNKSVTHFNGNHASFNKSGGNGSGNGKAGAGRKIKSPYCWNFNKGVKCKFGNQCKFIERCSYCDAPNHGVHVCPKLQKKEGGELMIMAQWSKLAHSKVTSSCCYIYIYIYIYICLCLFFNCSEN